MRRAAGTALRLLGRGLQAESKQLGTTLAARSLLVGSQLAGALRPGSHSVPVAVAAFSSSAAARASDLEPYSGIFYPEPEAEVGCPAPDFTAAGEWVADTLQ